MTTAALAYSDCLQNLEVMLVFSQTQPVYKHWYHIELLTNPPGVDVLKLSFSVRTHSSHSWKNMMIDQTYQLTFSQLDEHDGSSRHSFPGRKFSAGTDIEVDICFSWTNMTIYSTYHSSADILAAGRTWRCRQQDWDYGTKADTTCWHLTPCWNDTLHNEKMMTNATVEGNNRFNFMNFLHCWCYGDVQIYVSFFRGAVRTSRTHQSYYDET